MIHFVPMIFLFSALAAVFFAIIFGFMFRALRKDGARLFYSGDTFANSRLMLFIAFLFACPFFGNAGSSAFEYVVDFLELLALWSLWAYAFATVAEGRFVSWREFLFRKKEERKPDPKWPPKKDDKKDKFRA